MCAAAIPTCFTSELLIKAAVRNWHFVLMEAARHVDNSTAAHRGTDRVCSKYLLWKRVKET